MKQSKVGNVHGNVYAGPGDRVRDRIKEIRYKNKANRFVGKDVSVLNVAEDYVEFPHHRDVLYVHAGLNDAPKDQPPPWGEANSAASYVHAVFMLDRLVDITDIVYVHCHEGVSRTGIILSLYFAWIYKISPEEAERRIKTVYDRIRVHPKHWEVAPEVMDLLSIHRSVCRRYWRRLGMIGG